MPFLYFDFISALSALSIAYLPAENNPRSTPFRLSRRSRV